MHRTIQHACLTADSYQLLRYDFHNVLHWEDAAKAWEVLPLVELHGEVAW